MRLIDADALSETIGKWQDRIEDPGEDQDERTRRATLTSVLIAIEDAPTVMWAGIDLAEAE